MWYVRSGSGDPVGPFSTDLVVRGVQAGRVPPDAAVMDDADGAWRPLATVPVFAAARPGGAPAHGQAAGPVPPAPSAARPALPWIGAFVAAALAGAFFLLRGEGVVRGDDLPRTPQPTAEAAVVKVWADHDALPAHMKTTDALVRAHNHARDLVQRFPEGPDRVSAATENAAALRRRAAKVLSPESYATGADATTIVPSDDQGKCLVHGPVWLRDAGDSLRGMGFQQIKCASKQWDL
jgi:hypothetical protein